MFRAKSVNSQADSAGSIPVTRSTQAPGRKRLSEPGVLSSDDPNGTLAQPGALLSVVAAGPGLQHGAGSEVEASAGQAVRDGFAQAGEPVDKRVEFG